MKLAPMMSTSIKITQANLADICSDEIEGDEVVKRIANNTREVIILHYDPLGDDFDDKMTAAYESYVQNHSNDRTVDIYDFLKKFTEANGWILRYQPSADKAVCFINYDDKKSIEFTK